MVVHAVGEGMHVGESETDCESSKGESQKVKYGSFEDPFALHLVYALHGTSARAPLALLVGRNVGKYQNGTSYTRVSARHNWDASAPL